MSKFLRCALFTLAAAAIASAATAGELTLKIADGRATIIAKDVPVRQILAEWARVGSTRVVNAEKMPGGPVTLELVDVPEKEALDILLRSAAGYMAAPRPAHVLGASQFDRVIILATSRPPAAVAATPPQPLSRPAVAQLPPQPPPDDDDGEPEDQGPMPPNMVGPNGQIIGPNGQVQPFPGPAPVVNDPNAPVGVGPNGPFPVNQAPVTLPRPGMLPQQPQVTPGNPFTNIPAGVRQPQAPSRPGPPDDPDR